jgi:hypothetical protein
METSTRPRKCHGNPGPGDSDSVFAPPDKSIHFSTSLQSVGLSLTRMSSLPLDQHVLKSAGFVEPRARTVQASAALLGVSRALGNDEARRLLHERRAAYRAAWYKATKPISVARRPKAMLVMASVDRLLPAMVDRVKGQKTKSEK